QYCTLSAKSSTLAKLTSEQALSPLLAYVHQTRICPPLLSFTALTGIRSSCGVCVKALHLAASAHCFRHSLHPRQHHDTSSSTWSSTVLQGMACDRLDSHAESPNHAAALAD